MSDRSERLLLSGLRYAIAQRLTAMDLEQLVKLDEYTQALIDNRALTEPPAFVGSVDELEKALAAVPLEPAAAAAQYQPGDRVLVRVFAADAYGHRVGVYVGTADDGRARVDWHGRELLVEWADLSLVVRR